MIHTENKTSVFRTRVAGRPQQKGENHMDRLDIVAGKLRWPHDVADPIRYWREKILLMGHLIGGIAGVVLVFLLSFHSHLKEGHPLTAYFGVFGFLWVLLALFSRGRLAYPWRAAGVLALVYLAALVTLTEVGPSSAAGAELVCIPIFTALLFGMRATIFSIVLIAVTLVAVGWLSITDMMPWHIQQMALSRYPRWAAWLVFWASLGAFGVGIVFKGMTAAVQKEKDLHQYFEMKVGKRTEELEVTNRMLHEENRERTIAEKEKAESIRKLQTAIDEIKTLEGLLPICASCKNIRDEKGNWNQIESYLKKHTEADFSHGICPECKDKLYKGL